MEVADDVNTLMRREMQLSVPSQNSLKISDEQMKQLQECIMSSKNQPVERLQGLLTPAQFETLQGLLAETATPSQPLCPGAAAPSNSASWATSCRCCSCSQIFGFQLDCRSKMLTVDGFVLFNRRIHQSPVCDMCQMARF